MHVVVMLGVVGSSLKLIKFEPTRRNISQQGGQTYATCCAQQCCAMLRWHVAIVWPGLKSVCVWEAKDNGMTRFVLALFAPAAVSLQVTTDKWFSFTN